MCIYTESNQPENKASLSLTATERLPDDLFQKILVRKSFCELSGSMYEEANSCIRYIRMIPSGYNTDMYVVSYLHFYNKTLYVGMLNKSEAAFPVKVE